MTSTSESPQPEKSNRKLFLLAGFLLFAAFVGFVQLRTSQSPPLELFLHKDGTVSEGRITGERIPPDQIDLSGFDPDNPFSWRKIILNAPAETPLVALNEVFKHTILGSNNSFQIRLGSDSLDFHFPVLDGNPHLTRHTDPLVMIDLRTDAFSPYEPDRQYPDVLLLADELTTVESFLKAALPYRKSGTSLMVRGSGFPRDHHEIEIPVMIRRRDEDATNRVPSYSLASKIRMAFRFD